MQQIRGGFEGDTDPFTVIVKSLAIIKISSFTKIVGYYHMSDTISRVSISINSLNPHDNTRRSAIPFCRDGNGSPERLSKHRKVTQPVSGRTRVLESAVKEARC